MEFITDQLRTLFFFIDNIVYSLISNAYELIIYLANLDLYTDNHVVKELVNRIYVLLGIFMLFKISFSIIQYIIDPNAFSDKAKGFGKLLTNTMVAIVLLVSVPFIFQKAYQLQNFIIKDNVITHLILGQKFDSYSNNENSNTAENIKQMATDVQFALFGAFYTLNTTEGDNSAITECAPNKEKVEYKKNDGTTVKNEKNGATSNVFGSRDMAQSEPCLTALNDKWANENAVKERGIVLQDFFKTASGSGESTVISDNRSFSAFDSLLWWKIEPNKNYTVNYLPVVSTITGGYLLFILITFCIDIAARAIKLLFLQTVAPIAIVSYMDPKESISQGKLRNWTTECFKTFLSLFLRLATIFLAIRLVQMVTETIFFPREGASIYYDELQVNETMNMFVYVFLILGIFTFAKQVPKMIEGIFGIKLSGEMGLNPFKSLRENAGFTALAGGAVGGLATSVSSAATGYRMHGGGVKGALFGAKAGMLGAVSGAATGGYGGYQTKGKGGYADAGMKAAGSAAWRMSNRQGTDLSSRLVADFQSKTGGPMSAETYKQELDTYKGTTEKIKAIKESGLEFMRGDDGQATAEGRNLVQKDSNYEAKKERFKDANKYGSRADVVTAQMQLDVAQREQEAAKKMAMEAYINKGHMKPSDKDLMNAVSRESLENGNYAGYNGKAIENYDDLIAADKQVKTANSELSNSDRLQNAVTAKEGRDQVSKTNWRNSQRR